MYHDWSTVLEKFTKYVFLSDLGVLLSPSIQYSDRARCVPLTPGLSNSLTGFRCIYLSRPVRRRTLHENFGVSVSVWFSLYNNNSKVKGLFVDSESSTCFGRISV